MRKVVRSVLFGMVASSIGGAASATAADFVVEEVVYCAQTQVGSLGNEYSKQSDGGSQGILTERALFRGNVEIYEIDPTTLETRLTKIPASLAVRRAGALLRLRTTGRGDCKLSIAIHNNRGKSVGSLFGRYRGGAVGASLIFSLGMKVLVNPEGHYLAGMDTILGGVGVEATYVEFNLVAGAAATNEVEVADRARSTSEKISKEEVFGTILH